MKFNLQDLCTNFPFWNEKKRTTSAQVPNTYILKFLLNQTQITALPGEWMRFLGFQWRTMEEETSSLEEELQTTTSAITEQQHGFQKSDVLITWVFNSCFKGCTYTFITILQWLTCPPDVNTFQLQTHLPACSPALPSSISHTRCVLQLFVCCSKFSSYLLLTAFPMLICHFTWHLQCVVRVQTGDLTTHWRLKPLPSRHMSQFRFQFTYEQVHNTRGFISSPNTWTHLKHQSELCLHFFISF